MAVNSTEECHNVRSAVVLPDGGPGNPQYETPPNISHVEVPIIMKTGMCLNSGPTLLSLSNLKMDKVDTYAPSNLDVDIEKGLAENPQSNEESIAIMNSDDSVAGTAETNLLTDRRKIQQLLMKHGAELPKFSARDKFVAERVYDTLTNRSRKYKRSHSFNSRRVVLMFSIFSSIGTIILIYLTLRVRKISNGYGNV